MSFPDPTLPLSSRSSSFYSEDDLSETNSTGTQIHHKSKMLADTDDCEHGHYSDHSLLADASTDRTSVAASGRPRASYRFEALGEVEGRRQGAIGSDFDTEESSPRPRTPPRRRPRVTSTGSISLQSSLDTTGSRSLAVASAFMNDRGVPDISRDGPPSGRPEECSPAIVAQPTTEPSESSEDSQMATRRRENRAKAFNALSGRRKDAPTEYDSLDDIGVQGPTGLVSSTDPLRRPKDYSAGYLSGMFVTDLQNYQSPQPVEPKKRRARRLFCF